MTSRFNNGGFEDRFRVTRTDGKPIRETARYLVLDYSGADPHAIEAIKTYAQSIRDENSRMADDLLAAIETPENFPSQHCANGVGYKVLTGVSAIISAAHRSTDGVMHGHTWEIKAWWIDSPCAVQMQAELRKYLAIFDHTLLGDELAWGEAMGKSILLGLGCVKVEVSRPLEGIFAVVKR